MIILLLAIVAQSAQDVEFARVSETWVARNSASWYANQGLPELVLQLGDPRWVAREAADRAIAIELGRYFRHLVRSEHSPDLEIAWRSKLLLSRLYICRLCRGSGRCQECLPPRNAPCTCNYHKDCWGCSGSGDARFTRSPDGEEWVEFDLFGTPRAKPTRTWSPDGAPL